MKTASSIRDEIFAAAERTAKALGMSRSELYTRAVDEFVARHSGEQVTDRLNAVYEDGIGGIAVPLAQRCRHVVKRGEIRWAELPVPEGSEPGYRRPVLVV